MDKTTLNTLAIGVCLTIALMAITLSIYKPKPLEPLAPPLGTEVKPSLEIKPGLPEPAGTRSSDFSAGNSSTTHPGFPLPDLKGKKLSPADYRGKVVLVNFWATWCAPCRQEIPDFLEVYKQYHAKGLEILGVSVDNQGAQVVKPYAEGARIDYPVLIGNDQLLISYGIQGIPTTLVLDRQGKLHTRLVGAQNRASLEALVKSLL